MNNGGRTPTFAKRLHGARGFGSSPTFADGCIDKLENLGRRRGRPLPRTVNCVDAVAARVSGRVRVAYWEWLEQTVLREMRETQAALYTALVDEVAGFIWECVGEREGVADDGD